MVKVRSNQEEIEPNMYTGGEITKSSVETEVVRTGYRLEIKGKGKKSLHIVETKEKEENIHKLYADIVCG